jgi:drug/metabolite transporter (DMT)-like permease
LTLDQRPDRSRLAGLGRRRPVGVVFLGAVIYSTGPVMVQAASATGAVFSLWRTWIGAVLLGVAAVIHVRVSGRRPSLRACRWAVAAGVAFALHQLMLFMAIKATSVADVTLISALGPVITALVALPFFRERPGAPFRWWSAVAMAGTALVVLGASTGPQGDPLGMVLALGNVLFFAVFFLLSKASRSHLDVLPFLFGVMFVAAVTTSLYVWVAADRASAVTSTDLVLATAVAVGPGALGHFVSMWPLRWVPANVPPLMQLSMPVLAALWAWWFLSEAITLWHLAGGVIIAIGVSGAVSSPSGRRFVRSQGASLEPSEG